MNDLIAHPWAIAIQMVNNDPQILTPEEAKRIVFAHENVLRRAIREVRMILPDLVQAEELTPRGMNRIEGALLRASHEESPDL